MAKPSEKSEQLERDTASIFGFDRRENIRKDICVPAPIGCGGPATEFRDDISRKEYTISGLCQKCQDAFYGKREE